VESAIEYRIYLLKTSNCKILEVDCVPAGSDSARSVISSWLVISGYIIPATLQHTSPDSVFDESDWGGWFLHVADNPQVRQIYFDCSLGEDKFYFARHF
jgi:hypothetical protein